VPTILLEVLPAILTALAATATKSMRAVVRSALKSPRRKSYVVKVDDGEYEVIDAQDSRLQERGGK
jgi:hypothetical protein